MNPYAIEVMREVGVDLDDAPLEVGADDRPGHGRHRHHALRRGGLPGVPGQGAPAALADPGSGEQGPVALARGDARRASAPRATRSRRRLEVLAALLDLPEGPQPQEFHASVRVKDLAKSTRFYAWLLGAEPKEWTHRYATFVRPELHTNFVLVVSDGKELHHDTLYHLGIAVADKAAVDPRLRAREGRRRHGEQAAAHDVARHAAPRAVARGPRRQPRRDLRAPHARRARAEARRPRTHGAGVALHARISVPQARNPSTNVSSTGSAARSRRPSCRPPAHLRGLQLLRIR